MSLLLLKLALAPLLILAASLAGRRWGDSIGGWFVGLPLTSGPVCFLLALQQGTGFAAAAARGCLAGAMAEAGFCLAYGIAARHAGWRPALLAGTGGFAAVAATSALGSPPLALLTLFVAASLGVALWQLPSCERADNAIPLPRWDLPARMIIASLLVLSLTSLAPLLGARSSGILATYPVFAAVLTAFAHSGRGMAAATGVLRGLLLGLFGFTGFFALLAELLPQQGVVAGFACAALVALTIQAATFAIVRRSNLVDPLPPATTRVDREFACRTRPQSPTIRADDRPSQQGSAI